MARRAGLWALSGATAATGMLIASPDAYAWLRRKAGLDQSELAGDTTALHDDEGGSTFDTREARLSLRARLSESENEEPVAAPAAAARLGYHGLRVSTLEPAYLLLGRGAPVLPGVAVRGSSRKARAIDRAA